MIERASDSEEMSEQSETATLPASLIGGQTVSPGDVIRLKVVSVGEDGITVAYDHPKQEAGSDALAADAAKEQPSEEYKENE